MAKMQAVRSETSGLRPITTTATRRRRPRHRDDGSIGSHDNYYAVQSPPPRRSCDNKRLNPSRGCAVVVGGPSARIVPLLHLVAFVAFASSSAATATAAASRQAPVAAFVVGTNQFRRDTNPSAFLWRGKGGVAEHSRGVARVGFVHPTVALRGGVSAAADTSDAASSTNDDEETASASRSAALPENESVHLRLGSAAMIESMGKEEGGDESGNDVCDEWKRKGSGAVDNDNDDSSDKIDESSSHNNSKGPKDDDDNKPKAVKLYKYHDPSNNFTMHGLSVPMRKFRVFVDHSIAAAAADAAAVNLDAAANFLTMEPPPKPKFDPSFVSMEQVNVDDDDTRDRLRELWRGRRLISDRTEFLAVYRSDLKEKDGSKGSKGNSDGEEEERKHTGAKDKKKKRGDFADLLAVYADRLVGIIQDEQEEELNAEQKARKMQELMVRNMTEACAALETRLTDGVAGGLVGYLEREYGMDETRELMASSLFNKPEEEQFTTLQTFLEWFRSRFPYYYDRCDSCGASAKDEPPPTEDSSTANNEEEVVDSNGKEEEEDEDNDDDGGNFLGYVYPSEDELRGKAGRTEVYRCHRCGSFTRFPRYNSASTVMKSRRGRCGEYSMLLFRFLRAAGHEARWVVDWADHVWAEVHLGDRWVHLDPCEAALDQPLLYQEWGKRQTYIVAFHAPRPRATSAPAPQTTPLVEDVTHMYTSDGKEKIEKRRDEPAELVELSLLETEDELRLKLEEIQQKSISNT